MNSVNFNNAISNGSTSSSSSSNNIRQSRLIQPTSRMSYVPTLPNSSTSSSRLMSQNSSCTFLPTLSSKTTTHQREVKKPTTATTTTTTNKESSTSSIASSANKQMESQIYNYHKQYQLPTSLDQQIPNANTSGLPSPASKQRPTQVYTGEQLAQQRQQLISPSTTIPSTVGSALRRRQASPSHNSSIAKPNHSSRGFQSSTTNLSSLNASTCVKTCDQVQPIQQQGSFALRRSQSQRPSQAGITNHNYHHQHPQQEHFRQSTFGGAAAGIRSSKTLCSRSKSQLEQQLSLDDDETETDSSKCVESLPPLKSTTYLNHLMNSSNSNRRESKDIDAKSEPITTTTTTTTTTTNTNTTGSKSSSIATNNSFINSKPSQLVKPLVTKTRLSMTESQVGKKIEHTTTRGGLLYSQSASGKVDTNSNSSIKPPNSSMLPSLTSKLKSSESLSSSKRFSLQSSRFSNNNGRAFDASFDSNSNRKSLSGSEHESDGASNEDDTEGFDNQREEEDDDADEDDDDDDDDDDATTAETMTQMSDSNMILTNANQELNNMIQMLSSSAILGESGIDLTCNRRQDLETRKTEKKKKRVERVPSLSSYRAKPSQTSSNASKIKNELIKSQSLSFDNTNIQYGQQKQKQKTIPNGNQRVSLSKISSQSSFSGNSNQYGDRRSIQQQQCNNEDLKLPRPRSRIIFDPTSSKFHVSNITTEDDKVEREQLEREDRYESVKYRSNNTSGENSSSETTNEEEDEEDLLNPLTGSSDVVAQSCDNEQDESSLKLIDTQNQIITLKYLPTISDMTSTITTTTITNNNNNISRHLSTDNEIDKNNRLKGSLDSLIIPGGAQRSTDDKLNKKFTYNEDAQTPYGSLPNSDHFNLHHHSDNNNHYSNSNNNNNHRKSPVGSALRSLFGLQSSSSRNSIHVVNNSGCGLVRNNSCNNGSNNKEKKVATIVRHGSLKSDSRLYMLDSVHDDRPIERKISLQDHKPTSSSPNQSTVSTSKHHLGSDLFQRASKKLSASSSSLTSKFKFISSASQISSFSNQSSANNNHATTTIAPTTTNKESNFNNHPNFAPPDGSISGYGKHYDKCGQNKAPNRQNSSQVTKNNSGLPPRVPSSENKPTNSLGNSSNNSSILNGINGCDRDAETSLVNNNTKDYSSATYCLDNDNDNTILSDTSTLNGDSNNIVYINKCSELERTIESLKNRLISKEKELTDLQLKQWSSDYLTEQLKSTISKLEKENAQLKAVMKNYDRVNL